MDLSERGCLLDKRLGIREQTEMLEKLLDATEKNPSVKCERCFSATGIA